MARSCLFTLVYYVSARAALYFALDRTNVAPVWPPSGIAVSILLLFGVRYWPLFLVSSFFVNVTTGQTPEMSSVFAVSNTCECVFAAWCLRSRGLRYDLRRLRDIVLLAIPGAFVSSLIAATMGTLGLWIGGGVAHSELSLIWRTYLLGDGMGILVFVPFLTVWSGALRSGVPSKRALAEFVLLEGLIFGASKFVFLETYYWQPYLMFPLIIWSAVRFGQLGATLNTLLISLMALDGAVRGLGPFAQGSVIDRLTELQLYIGALAMAALSLGAAVLAQRDFQREVLERTAQLERAGALFRGLLESAPDPRVILDARDRIFLVNRQAEKQFGYQRKELENKHIGMLVPDFSAASARRKEELAYVRASGSADGFEAYAVRKNGTRFPVEIRLSLLEREKGYLISSVIRDVTDRKRFERALQEKNAELQKAYQREERIASSFQEASLIKEFPEVPGVTFSCYYEPGKSEALLGGDWYDALRLSDGRLIVSIGDVSGSGLRAAVTMANVRQVIRGTGYVYPDPVAMLNAADKVLRAEHPDTIVTAFVGIIDPIERTMQYASAGHPPPYLRHSDGRLEELRAHGLVLGLRGRQEPPAQSIAIEDGDSLVLYTDGLVESRRSYEEGERRLRDALSGPSVYVSSDPAKALYDAVLFDGARDDVAILIVGFAEIEMGQRLMCWSFDTGDAAAVRHARLAFVERLRGNLTNEEIAAAELVFMELIGNVARHAPGCVEVWIEAGISSVLLHVIDRGPGFRYSSKLPLDPLSESGRGLYLISVLTEEFYVSRACGKGSHACAVFRAADNRAIERAAIHA